LLEDRTECAMIWDGCVVVDFTIDFCVRVYSLRWICRKGDIDWMDIMEERLIELLVTR
jgi:hypothetical protein